MFQLVVVKLLAMDLILLKRKLFHVYLLHQHNALFPSKE